MRLAEDRFYNTYPCIILTAKGQPDVASRYTFLMHLLDSSSISCRPPRMWVPAWHSTYPCIWQWLSALHADRLFLREAQRYAQDTCACSGGL